MSLLSKSIHNKKKNHDYWLDVTEPNYTTWGRQPHFFQDMIIPAKEKENNSMRACNMCTTLECKICLVALQIPGFFQMYHTLQKQYSGETM